MLIRPEAPSSRPPRQLFGVPREIVMLGVVSFLTDVSSEAIFAVLPLFLTSVLGASPLVLGAMEGLADFAASSLDMASGYVSDRLCKRKSIAVIGYVVSSAAKAVLLVASTAAQVVAFRVIERLGKSIRGAPRDALLSGIATKEERGASFGLHKAFDKSGAIVGPLVAYAFLDRFGHSLDAFHTLFAVALVPALASVAVLVFFVHEHAVAEGKSVRFCEALRTFGPGYRHYLMSAGIFSFAYFSFAFLLLAASRAGFEMKHVVLLYGLFNVSFTVVSVPIGRLSDRIGRRTVIAFSYVLYALMATGFAVVHSKLGVALLFLVYGIFYAIDEGQTKAYVADLTPEETRATAIGTYGFVTALVYLPASLVAGALWNAFGSQVTFGTAAAVALLALVYLLAFEPRAATT
ncbi:MAG TPA: MFS transporter [Candidatus Binatia bacterium]|nr:MFS transporter [Candidatus Binatia bacterium]